MLYCDNFLGRYQENPLEERWRVLRYLQGDKNQKLVLKPVHVNKKWHMQMPIGLFRTECQKTALYFLRMVVQYHGPVESNQL